MSNTGKYKDITNMRFGKLVTLEFVCTSNRGAVWKCKCDCGNEVNRLAAELKRNKSHQSCGCMKKVIVSKAASTNIINNTNIGRLKSVVIPRNNTSGCKGVCWHKRKNKWYVYIQCQGKKIYLGLYDDLNDAIKVRKQAEEIYFKPILEEYNEKRTN